MPVMANRHEGTGGGRRTRNGHACHGGASTVHLYTSSILAHRGLSTCRSDCTRTVTGCNLRHNVHNSRTQRAAATRCCHSLGQRAKRLRTGIRRLRARERRTRRGLSRIGRKVGSRGLRTTGARTGTTLITGINSLLNNKGLGTRERKFRRHVTRLRGGGTELRRCVGRVRHRRRTRYVGFDRCVSGMGQCFPRISGLLPLVSFYHGALRFSRRVVRRLYGLGGIGLGNSFCSPRFGHGFRTRNTTFSFRRSGDEAKRFQVYIGSVPLIR